MTLRVVCLFQVRELATKVAAFKKRKEAVPYVYVDLRKFLPASYNEHLKVDLEAKVSMAGAAPPLPPSARCTSLVVSGSKQGDLAAPRAALLVPRLGRLPDCRSNHRGPDDLLGGHGLPRDGHRGKGVVRNLCMLCVCCACILMHWLGGSRCWCRRADAVACGALRRANAPAHCGHVRQAGRNFSHGKVCECAGRGGAKASNAAAQ